jgi:Icc-related predicted phosphoesterase
VGDIHIGRDMTGSLRVSLSHVRERADILLLAGDLTQHGDPAEGEIVARELAAVGVPIVSVLGNHEYHQGQQQRIRDRLEAAGVIVLEGEGTVLNVGGQRVGVGGVKGFGGGFAGACGSEFGEDEMKAFIRHSRLRAEALHEALSHLECDFKIALTHFSPTKGTLVGEKPEIHPFLGSYFLGEAIDATGCHLALHGHAHLGTERAVTPGGVPVRNVARPVIKLAYKLYAFGDRADVELAATEYVASASSARVSAIPAARQSG